MLEDFINEIRSGRRESSAFSTISTDSLPENEKAEWRQLRKEMQGIGITPEIFSLNRDFILTTLRTLSQIEFGNLVSLPVSPSKPPASNLTPNLKEADVGDQPSRKDSIDTAAARLRSWTRPMPLPSSAADEDRTGSLARLPTGNVPDESLIRVA